MENQTRFDLDSAVSAWKQKLVQKSGVSEENARELESHLLESIAAFKRGLGDREAFRAACLHIGEPQALGQEFAKANVLKVLRERVFWMAFGVFGLSIWFSGVGLLTRIWLLILPDSVLGWAGKWFLDLLLLAILIRWILIGGLSLIQRSGWFIAKRWRFFAALFGLWIAGQVALEYMFWTFPVPGQIGSDGGVRAMPAVWMSLVNTVTSFAQGPLFPIALMVWLLPSTYRLQSLRDDRVATAENGVVWRERAFWMTIGMLGIHCWQTVASPLKTRLQTYAFETEWLHGYLGAFAATLTTLTLYGLPVLLAGILLASGRFRCGEVLKLLVSGSRIGVGLIAVVLVLFSAWIQLTATYEITAFSWLYLINIVFPLFLVGVIVWLMPKREDRTAS